MDSSDCCADLFNRHLFLSYMDYFATGEGRTTCLAIAGYPGYAEEVLRGHLDAYFLPFVVTVAIEHGMDESASGLLALIPDEVRRALRELPRSAVHYFAELYINLT